MRDFVSTINENIEIVVYKKHFRFDNMLKLLIVLFILIILLGIFTFKVDTSKKVLSVGDAHPQGIKATIYGLDCSNWLKADKDVDSSKPGVYFINYKFKLFPGFRTYTQEIDVLDNVPPVLQLAGEKEVHLQRFKDFVEPGYTCIDNYDGDITDRVDVKATKINDDYYEISYEVRDSSGNNVALLRMVYIDIPIPEEEQTRIYLTFDDGPSSNVTPQILDILDANGVKATFFICGYGDDKVEIVRRVLASGHTLGVHGYTHDYKKLYASVDSLVNNFIELAQRIVDTTSYNPKFIRFPGGASNTVSRKYSRGVVSQGAQRMHEMGYEYFDWNVDSGDAGKAKDAESIFNNVTTHIEEKRANVVLMHDSAGHQATADALDRIIKYCQENRYVLLPIDENTPIVQHTIAN